MKRISIASVVAASVLLVACNSNSNTNNNEAADVSATEEVNVQGEGEISFVESIYDFGELEEGEIVEHKFAFTNTGAEPVIISRVSTSCGCTSPEYTATPVGPGKDGEISVRFDSKGQKGVQQKIITVASNAKDPVQTVQLKGVVL